jgi:hypothetical protein
MSDEKPRNTKRRNSPTSAVYGRTIDGVRKAKDNPLMEAMGMGDEVIMEYCPIFDEKFPINYFYPVSGSNDDVRRVCRKAWDCRVTDPDTGKRLKASGVIKYDWLVKKELGLHYVEPESGDNPCLML